uniref:CRISPR system endoribonuclease Csx1 CARF domain-containing protein n=1 Tax=Thermofilum adornatum TaxID=1365176 RepID=A0A7C1CGF7_9CREN
MTSSDLSSNKDDECFSQYEEVFLFSTWGDPTEWESKNYCIECIINEKKTKKCFQSSQEKFFSTTRSIIKILPTNILDKDKICIFLQDTLLINHIIESNIELNKKIKYWWRDSQDNIKHRKDLFESILQYILHTEAFKNDFKENSKINIKDKEDASKIFKILPGTVSYNYNSNHLFNWRGDDFFSYILGGILAHVIDKLRLSEKNNVAVIYDTSHGVNYFALALEEAIPLACSLLAIQKAFTDTPEYQIHLFHYNSQPLISKDSSTPSISLDLVSYKQMRFYKKQGFFVNNGVFFDTLRTRIESIFSQQRFEDVYRRLHSKVPGIDTWEQILATALLFVRGILPWALHIARFTKLNKDGEELAIETILNQVKERLEATEIEFKINRENFEYRATYKWNKQGTPDIDAITLLSLSAILKEASKKILASCDYINEIITDLEKNPTYSKDHSTVVDVHEISKAESCSSIELDKIAELAEKVYSKPFSVIARTEIERIKSYFENTASEKLSKYYECRALKDFQICIPLRGHPEERDFYAHLGLVRGTKHSIIQRRGDNDYKLILGPYDDIVSYLKQWGA